MRWTRRVFSHPAFTGISRRRLHLLRAELHPAWLAQREGRLHARRGGNRRRAAGAGRPPVLRFADRLLLTLAHLRLGLPHEALAAASAVDRSTVTRAIGQIRPLLAGRGCALPGGIRLRTLADVFAYAAAEGVTLRLDATEIRVRRPRAGRGRPQGLRVRQAQAEHHHIKTTLAADEHGATLWCGSTRPGRMHDTTAARVEGIDALLRAYPQVKVLVDAGYQGLAKDHPEQVTAPPLKLRPGALPARQAQWEAERKAQSSQRIPVEHAIAEHKWWRVLQRFTGRRELLPETIAAVAGIVSDRAITWYVALPPSPSLPDTKPQVSHVTAWCHCKSSWLTLMSSQLIECATTSQLWHQLMPYHEAPRGTMRIPAARRRNEKTAGGGSTCGSGPPRRGAGAGRLTLHTVGDALSRNRSTARTRR